MSYKITLIGGPAAGQVLSIQQLIPRVKVPIVRNLSLLQEFLSETTFHEATYYIHCMVDAGGLETWVGITGEAEEVQPLRALVSFYAKAHKKTGKLHD